jgi:ATP-binding cassette subfamily F protein uup
MQLLRDYEATLGRLQQEPHDPALQARFAALTGDMDRLDGWTAEANAKAILTRLGVADFTAPVATLSGGQRKRVALARALLDPADLLILDEPTNHIDADAVDWLEQVLLAMPAALLLVTHDRYFLDRVVNRIVELDRRQLVSFPGNYTRYLEQSDQRHQRLAKAEEDRRRLLHRELVWLRRSPMARTSKQKARKERVRELERIRYDSRQDQVAMVLASRRLGKKVLTAQGLVKSYPLPDPGKDGDELVVFSGVDFELAPGDRVGIIGPNGAGKSTFLDILAGVQAPDRGSVVWGETVRLGYYDQRNVDLDESQRVIDFVKGEAELIRIQEKDTPSWNRTAVDIQLVDAARMLEWFLFPRPQQWATIGSLSGGERRRLYLLRTLVHQPNVLLLDEPTNDFDIQTLTVLEEFLDHFQGCLVVASHDRYFLDRTVDYLVSFDPGSVVSGRYPAPYDVYRSLRDQEKQAVTDDQQAPSRPSPAPRSLPSQAPARRLTWREQRELEQLEARVERLEEEKAVLQLEVNASGHDYERLQTLAEQLQALDSELDAAMARWLELSDMETSRL